MRIIAGVFIAIARSFVLEARWSSYAGLLKPCIN
jgi:hypothetical protein